MSFEENVKDAIIKKFNLPAEKARIQRPRRIFIDVAMKDLEDILIFSAKDLGFTALGTITGLDEGENLSFIYHLCNINGAILNVKTSVPKNNPVLKTVIGIFPAAEIYERELEDLLGAKVEGLPEGNRYPLPDNWPKDQYPLRKDWKADTQIEKEKCDA